MVRLRELQGHTLARPDDVSIPKWCDWEFHQSKDPLIHTSFNSKMVRLRGAVGGKSFGSVVVFQFQNGAIERTSTMQSGGSFASFNSKMVRLRDVKPPQVDAPHSRFQFQNGAIERRENSRTRSSLSVSIPKWCDWELPAAQMQRFKDAFQFQNGAIERNSLGLRGGIIPCFNSKMVRLREREPRRLAPPAIGFNSKMVRLRVFWCRCRSRNRNVSIPKWCDWEVLRRCARHTKHRVSIPKWCDWELRNSWGAAARHVFQFQNGAIESQNLAPNLNSAIVSIPKWCDWEAGDYFSYHTHQLVSIPKWCDWEQKHHQHCTKETQFQFQNGAIESGITYAGGNRFGYSFNSKMVRLRGPGCRRLYRPQSFQFQNGAIESSRYVLDLITSDLVSIPKWCDWEGVESVEGTEAKSFNSKMVRLRAPTPTQGDKRSIVSIPKWCDWERPWNTEYTGEMSVSIPKWCDWEVPGLLQS